MKNTKVTLMPLTADDREQFILDNQLAFKYGALQEFGERDDILTVTERLSHAGLLSTVLMIQITKLTVLL